MKINKHKIRCLIELGGDGWEALVERDVAFRQEVEEHILRRERIQRVNSTQWRALQPRHFILISKGTHETADPKARPPYSVV